MNFPVLPSFEKDLTTIVFTINQLSRGLDGVVTELVGITNELAVLREPLTADRTYYVATTGSDSNNGLTVGTPFLTIQKAIDVAYGKIDLAGFNVMVQLADGTYSGAIIVPNPQVGTGTITLQGNIATPSNVIVTSSATATITVQQNAVLAVSHFQIQSTGSICLYAALGGIIKGGDGMVFGSVAGGFHIYAINTGTIDFVSASYSIVGNAGYHILTNTTGFVRITSGTVTIATARAFTTFIFATGLSVAEASTTTFTGAGVAGTTGNRYAVTVNGVIITNGGGANYFPGSVAGSVSSGGQYT